MIFFEPHLRDRNIFPYDPFKAMVVPRPVGWISTMAPDGRVNLAPYSFFNAFSGAPPLVGFSSEGYKDSAAFAEASGEFVWNMATYDLRMEMNATSAPLERGASEFVHAGLETAPSSIVKAPRVAASPGALECKVTQIICLQDMTGTPTDRYLVMGQVVGIHVDERYLVNGMLDIAAMQPIARCGYQDYAVVDKVFAVKRPAGAGNQAGGG
ncbi:MAG: flavin reductase family protein [Hyphomicrobiales bacterium]|nr:flavin reductase family protein [Hyphomicrobiales bacterium]